MHGFVLLRTESFKDLSVSMIQCSLRQLLPFSVNEAKTRVRYINPRASLLSWRQEMVLGPWANSRNPTPVQIKSKKEIPFSVGSPLFHLLTAPTLPTNFDETLL